MPHSTEQREEKPMPLDTKPRIARPDDFYEALIEAHLGLDDNESMKLNAKLVLILANQVGDMDMLLEAIAMARCNASTLEEKKAG